MFSFVWLALNISKQNRLCIAEGNSPFLSLSAIDSCIFIWLFWNLANMFNVHPPDEFDDFESGTELKWLPLTHQHIFLVNAIDSQIFTLMFWNLAHMITPQTGRISC